MLEVTEIDYFRRVRGKLSPDGEPLYELHHQSIDKHSHRYHRTWHYRWGFYSETGMLRLMQMRDDIQAAAEDDLSEGPDGIFKEGWSKS